MSAVDPLKHTFTGHEMEKLAVGSIRTCSLIARMIGQTWEQRPSRVEIERVRAFYQNRRAIKGVFGGPLSQGDAVFVSECIRRLRPSLVVEIGVASGFSSLVILSAMERHGLLQGPDTGLISIDIKERHAGDPEKAVGQVVGRTAPHLLERWTLKTGQTAIDYFNEPSDTAPTLAFVDGGHFHPWPAIDLFVLSRKMPEGSWVLLQDIALAERLLIGSIRRASKAAVGWRGAQIAFEHWLGPKFRGIDACFNMAAVQLCERDIVDKSIRDTMTYPFERTLDDRTCEFLTKTMGMADAMPDMERALGTGPRPPLGLHDVARKPARRLPNRDQVDAPLQPDPSP